MADIVYLKSPQGEVKEVEATAEKLTPLLVAGYHQVPAPTEQKPAAAIQEER